MLKRERVNLVVAADLRFLLPLVVTIYSAARSCSQSISLTIITPDIIGAITSKVDAIFARAAKEGSTINWKYVPLSEVEKLPIRLNHLSPATYLRLLAPNLITATERVIYLDCDIVVTADLAEMWSTEFDDAIIGASLDIKAPLWRIHGGIPYVVVQSPECATNPVFNAGSMLIDVDRWRRFDCLAKVMDFCGKWPKEAASDQDGLNFVLQGRWHQLSPKWNHQVGGANPEMLETLSQNTVNAIEAVDEADAIMHYSTAEKPWNSGLIRGRREVLLWVSALEESGWFNPVEFTRWRTVRFLTLTKRAVLKRLARAR